MSLISDFFEAQLAVLKSDLAKDVIPKLQIANNNIASNPTEINLIAQGQSILATLIAEGPTVMQDEIKALANFLNVQLGQLAAKAPAPSAASQVTGGAA